METISQYGLFPRGMIELFTRLQTLQGTATDVRYVMTVSAVELALEGNLDMFIKSQSLSNCTVSQFGASDPGVNGVSLDRTCSPPRLYGMTEVPDCLLVELPFNVLLYVVADSQYTRRRVQDISRPRKPQHS